MDKKHFEPRNLEHYSFIWSQARLLVAAVALLIGGVPVLRAVLPMVALSGLVNLVLTLTWIISGVASGYLLYRYVKNQQMIFGGRNQRDRVAFLISIISGFNLGLTGLTGNNIGMSISSDRVIFAIVAIIYLITLVYLHKRWQASGKKLFG